MPHKNTAQPPEGGCAVNRSKLNIYFRTMLTLPHITSEYEKLVFPLKLSVGETVNNAG